eukprot:6194852-Pleurochrysis_carterae.AAC.1
MAYLGASEDAEDAQLPFSGNGAHEHPERVEVEGAGGHHGGEEQRDPCPNRAGRRNRAGNGVSREEGHA